MTSDQERHQSLTAFPPFRVNDLAVGRYVHFPLPPAAAAASKAVAYHVSTAQCNTMPTNRPGTVVLDDLSLYGVKG